MPEYDEEDEFAEGPATPWPDTEEQRIADYHHEEWEAGCL